MKKIYILIFLISSLSFFGQAQNTNELKKYTDFLETQNTSAKAYILNLFKKYDIVILCERDHREITQYDLILDILKDKWFEKNVKNAYFEIGNIKNDSVLNAFVHNKKLSSQEVEQTALNIQRNSYGAALWEKANYLYYIKGVQNINKTLSRKNQVNIFGLDIGVDWETATEKDIRLRDSLMPLRDSILANNFINFYKNQKKSHKALIILNYRHAFLKDIYNKKNAGRFIANAFPEKVANVYINSFAFKENMQTNQYDEIALQNGKWDAAFIKIGKNNIGFDFQNTPFGVDNLDIFPLKNDFTFEQYFTGFVYYNYFPDLRIVTGINGYIDDNFAPEIMRRYKLEQKVYNNQIPTIEDLKKIKNTVEDKTYKEDKEDFGTAIKQIESWLK